MKFLMTPYNVLRRFMHNMTFHHKLMNGLVDCPNLLSEINLSAAYLQEPAPLSSLLDISTLEDTNITVR